MRLVLVAGFLLTGCSGSEFENPTAQDVRLAARKCGAVVTGFGPIPDHKTGPSNRQLGLPNAYLKIDIKSSAEFDTKANCMDRELKSVGAYSYIWGPNGEDLLNEYRDHDS